jgi:hypothetical protein
MPSQVFSDVKAMEIKLGLPVGFYSELFSESDWSFIIKLNALLEAACAHALVVRLNAPELMESFAHLEIGHSKYGKVVLLKKLGALTSEQGKVLQYLYELRNSLAHNITQVSFTFAAYIASLNSGDLERFVKNVGHGVQVTNDKGEKAITTREFIINNPKAALWMTTAEIIACLYLEHEIALSKLEKMALQLSRQITSTTDP